jgi:catechol 2,3-dioxygenase-like lactoylglutathione lyase family enzyme
MRRTPGVDLCMRFDHIAINVKCINDAIEWYKHYMSAEVEYADDTWAMLEVGASS